MVNRKDRYREYTGQVFHYEYPYKWEKRNKNYLKTVIDRDWRETETFVFPPKHDHKRQLGK